MSIDNRNTIIVVTPLLLISIMVVVLSAFFFPSELSHIGSGSAFSYTGTYWVSVNGRLFIGTMDEEGGGSILTGALSDLAVSVNVPSLESIDYPAVFLRTEHTDLDIYLNGQPYFSQKAGFLSFRQDYPIIMNIPRNAGGALLTIVYHNVADTEISIDVVPIVFGDRQVLEGTYISEDFPVFILGACIAFFSVILFIFSLFFRKNEGREILMSISLFALPATLLIVFRTDFIFSLVPSPFTVSEISLLLYSLLPAAMTNYIGENIIILEKHRRFRIALFTSVLIPLTYIFLTLPLLFSPSPLMHVIRSEWIRLTVMTFTLLMAIYSVKTGEPGMKYRKGSVMAILLYSVSDITVIIMSYFPITVPPAVYGLALIAVALMIQQSAMICIKSITGKEKREEMMKRLYTDPLTGLLNRRAFEDRADHIGPGRMTVISADINDMKHFNDSFGHSAGDELLTSFSKAVSAVLSDQDSMAFRMGGDEFLLLVRNKDTAEVDEMMKAAAEDFRASVTMDRASFTYGTATWDSFSGCSLRDTVHKSDEDLLIKKSEYHSRMRFSEGFSVTEPKTSF